MRLKVTRRQDELLTRLLAQLCELYNMALQQRRNAYRECRVTVSYYDQQKQLTELRGGVIEYASSPLKIQRDPLHRLDSAFKGFFRRIKSGENPGFPRFRSGDRYDSFAVDKESFHLIGSDVSIVKLGTFRTKTHCRIKGVPVELRVKRCGRKWQAQVVCDIGPAPEKVVVSKAVGIDVGLTTLATLSDGIEIQNPHWTKQYAEKLATTNQSLSRKRRGSKNRLKAKESLRRCHQRIAGARRAYLHGVSRQLVNSYDLIAYEDLKIKNMAKGHFAKGIMDAAWGELLFQLRYKAESAGTYVVAVNPRGTSQICSGCGVKVPKELAVRVHDCPHCGLSLGRDHNAALNILRLGESLVSKQNHIELLNI
jgi:putative transposase